jgi:hypothetical protein
MGGHFPPSEEFFPLRDELPIPRNPILQLRHELFHSSRVRRLQGLLVVVNHGDGAILCVRAQSQRLVTGGGRGC